MAVTEPDVVDNDNEHTFVGKMYLYGRLCSWHQTNEMELNLLDVVARVYWKAFAKDSA